MDYGTHETLQFQKDKCFSVATILKCLQLFCGLVATACAGAALSCTITTYSNSTSVAPTTVSTIQTSLIPETTTTATTTANTDSIPTIITTAQLYTKQQSETASYSSIEAFGQGWVMFVGSVCIIGTFCLWVTEICNVRNIYKSHRWFIGELIYTLIAAILYLMAFGVETWYATAGGWQPPTSLNAHGCYYGTWEASAAFAFFSLLLYIGGSIHVFLNRDG